MMSKICGHRGAVNYKPENTMSGFEWCVNNDIKWAECDVQLTDEDILIIIHDDTLDRTSDTKGLVKKITKKQLETINVGISNSKEKNFQKIPKLEELLKFCKSSGLKLNIEMKFYDLIKLLYQVIPIAKSMILNEGDIANKMTKSNIHLVIDKAQYSTIKKSNDVLEIDWNITDFDIQVFEDLKSEMNKINWF